MNRQERKILDSARRVRLASEQAALNTVVAIEQGRQQSLAQTQTDIAREGINDLSRDMIEATVRQTASTIELGERALLGSIMDPDTKRRIQVSGVHGSIEFWEKIAMLAERRLMSLQAEFDGLMPPKNRPNIQS
ncbi:MAG: hypothetical protein M1426_03530 [Patescibacteria group bacterium]|nr:hypothetical protein [Patescibacteria group bacterium]